MSIFLFSVDIIAWMTGEFLERPLSSPSTGLRYTSGRVQDPQEGSGMQALLVWHHRGERWGCEAGRADCPLWFLLLPKFAVLNKFNVLSCLVQASYMEDK